MMFIGAPESLTSHAQGWIKSLARLGQGWVKVSPEPDVECKKAKHALALHVSERDTFT